MVPYVREMLIGNRCIRSKVADLFKINFSSVSICPMDPPLTSCTDPDFDSMNTGTGTFLSRNGFVSAAIKGTVPTGRATACLNLLPEAPPRALLIIYFYITCYGK